MYTNETSSTCIWAYDNMKYESRCDHSYNTMAETHNMIHEGIIDEGDKIDDLVEAIKFLSLIHI